MTTTPTLNYNPRNHAVALRSVLPLLANQAPIEFDGTIKASNCGLPEGLHGQSPLLITKYEAEAKISVEASVWQDNLDRERVWAHTRGLGLGSRN